MDQGVARLGDVEQGEEGDRGQQPKGLEVLPEVEFDVVVAINWPEDEVLVKARMHLDWDIPDTDGLALREVITIRQLLRSKIETLLNAPLPA